MPNDGSNAYDRLFKNDRKQSQSQLSVDEQLSDDDASEDDDNMFFRGMSSESKAALYNRVYPEAVEDDVSTPFEDDELVLPQERPSHDEEDIHVDQHPSPDIESLITPTNKKRGRKPKVDNMNEQPRINSVSNPYESIIRMLALNMVNELKNSSYAYAQFSREETSLLWDYIKNKIKGE